MSEIPPWERNELLPDGGSRITDALHQLAVAMPDATAGEDATTTMTFAELERRSNQIANTILAAYPAGADGPVALVFGHGLGPFVTAIGALCTGLAVAPLEAREPLDRIIEIIEASAASLIVTDTENAESARAAGAGRPMLVLDDTVISAASRAAPTVAMSPDTPGFLFFTSGSTGAPKGVLSAHHQVLPRYVSLANEQGYRPGERVAVTASFGFSLAHTYFLAAVFGGATACCYDLKAAGPGRLPEWIVSRGITSVTFVPSMLRALPAHASRMDSVRLVTLGGETVYGHDVRRARAHFGEATTFKNLLGSAEAGIVATYVIPPEQPDDEPVPCGSLAPGLAVRVVDPDTGAPVATGASGRLVVVREHLSLRYRRDPELTAALYFTEPDGQRGFCTSDLVRFRDDGLLEHLGRLDARVKVRGAMVAPAAVAAALLATDVVADAAVVATDGSDGHTRLVAYVVPAPGETVSGWQLRRGLAQQLPTTMLPAAIVLLEGIPRTTRDKVDQDALPPAPAIGSAPYHEPRSDERALARLFADVLGVYPIGRDDDFFDLGGDSLAVVELTAMIHEHLGIRVTATAVLDAPTVASLSRRLQAMRSRPASVARVLGTLGRLGPRRRRQSPRPRPRLARSSAGTPPGYILRMPDSTGVDLAAWERNTLLPNGARELSPALHEIVRGRPDQLAVDDGEQRLSYAELLSQANRVANAITDRNADPTTPVVMLCGHGVRPIAGILGLVSAGHLVSPLDARDPADRLAQIITTSGASMIFAEREFADLAHQVGPDCTVLVLDEALAYPDTAPTTTIDDNTLGLIVFTSGSTGTPKGVVQGHRELVAKGVVRAFGADVRVGDRVVLNSSFNFSATFSRIFITVMSGASLYTYDPRVKGQRGYPDWVNANEITSLTFMTPLLRALLDLPSTPQMLGVRRVQVGGDTVYGIDVTRARRLFRPDVEFVAGFSSTETGGVCSYIIPPEDERDSRPVPIGVVEPWSEIRVVDPTTDEPVPDGEPGRLVVHNHLLARGYWRDPETTARHFHHRARRAALVPDQRPRARPSNRRGRTPWPDRLPGEGPRCAGGAQRGRGCGARRRWRRPVRGGR